MAEKKAPAKKAPAKKAAKKAAHAPERDARRAYEHLGRVQVLRGLAGSQRDSLETLAGLASRRFEAKRPKDAAELLRAAEHFAFAGLLTGDREELAESLRKEVKRELSHLEERAARHGNATAHGSETAELYRSAVQEARECAGTGAYRAALEYARAAEALTHVESERGRALPGKAAKLLTKG